MHLRVHQTGQKVSAVLEQVSVTHPADARPLFPIHRKASCACGGGCPTCQAKSNLKISQPNDPAEIEADAIADKVMRMPVGETGRSPHVSKGAENVNGRSPHGSKGAENLTNAQVGASTTIHRKCDACQDDEEANEPLMRKEAFASSAATPPPNGTPPSIRNVINSGGQPLDQQARSFFEPRFGYDLSSVRIHTDSSAGQSARSINAKAYTLGNNIVFGSGEYQPDSESGRHLLAHELAHVGQCGNSIYRQSRGMDGGVRRDPPPAGVDADAGVDAEPQPNPAVTLQEGVKADAGDCYPNPLGSHLPRMGTPHRLVGHPLLPCGLTEASVLASPNWCLDTWQVHRGEICYREIPASGGGPGRQYCYSTNCCHDSPDRVSPVDPASPGMGASCQTRWLSMPGHFWYDYL